MYVSPLKGILYLTNLDYKDGSFGFDGYSYTVTTLASYWNWCSPGAISCPIWTACQSGIIYSAGGSGPW
jgi:hypothetical protein